MTYDRVRLIKDSVDIRAVCELYGVHFIGGRNQALCPFHDDKNPSASVKNGRFHCFVCNLHLDCFDFVQQITGCDFQGAMEMLNQAFGLGLDLKKPIPTAEMRKLRAERARKAAELERYRADYNEHQTEFIALRRITRMCSPAPDKPYMGGYAWALGRLEQLEEYFADRAWR